MTHDLHSTHRSAWLLDPEVAFCNHGSFGACPVAVLDRQWTLRQELERDPVAFFVRRLPDLWDEARRRLADFVGADEQGVVFVRNATTGISTVLASSVLSPGDEILVTDHGYEACTLAAERRAAATGASVVTARIPTPCTGPDDVLGAIVDRAGPSTRLAIIDHISSPTALVLPLAEIVGRLSAAGVDVIVDGAHGPGQVPVDIAALGAAAYTGNAHKWLCAPKGAGFLWVREDLRDSVVPLVTSHGERHRREGRTHYHDRFDWTGTDDPTAYLAVPSALDHIAGMMAGGWPEVMERNHLLALEARTALSDSGCEPTGPETMIASMAAALLPHRVEPSDAKTEAFRLSALLFDEHRVQAPVTWWRGSDRLAVRMSAHLHTSLEDVNRLTDAVRHLIRHG